MRSLLKAALVLGPAFASAFVVPAVVDGLGWEDESPVTDHSFALLAVDLPSNHYQSHDLPHVLGFRIDVFPSENACGDANITINGEPLPQTLVGDVLTGSRSSSNEEKTILESWTLNCITVNSQPDSQFLKFIIEKVDGKSVENTGFTVLFRQTGTTEILNINTDVSTPELVAANPNPAGLSPSSHNDEFLQYSVENDMAELDWMYAQLHELKLMIAEKQEAIAAHAYKHSELFEEDLSECDSLKCVVTAVLRKVKHTAHEVYGKIAGEDDVFDEGFGHPKPPFKKPHWPKIPKFPHHPGSGKHRNHTCGHRHGNHTGNHTHPHPPHWKKPHHFLPICRLPPHHKPPHHKPPHHKPPHHEPPHHGPPHHGKPPGGDSPHSAPPGDDSPPPPPPHQGAFLSEAGESSTPRPHPGKEDSHPPRPGPKHFGPPPRHGMGKTLRIVKFGAIGFLLALFLIALHRRTCTASRRSDRRSRREERKRRRAFRRAAHKHSIRRFLARISGRSTDDDSTTDFEEKCEQMLGDSDDDMSTTMTEEITQFRNAASVVDDMVSAEEGRSRSIAYQYGHPPEPIPIPVREESALMRAYETGSQLDHGEELPAYEDSDESEMSSVVADGFRYTPGSSDYSPANSTGSASDILGPDTKT